MQFNYPDDEQIPGIALNLGRADILQNIEPVKVMKSKATSPLHQSTELSNARDKTCDLQKYFRQKCFFKL
jgi:hypothetical protein